MRLKIKKHLIFGVEFKMLKSISISDFSPHLFWDTDKQLLDLQTSKAQIIYQVVEFGMMKDWQLIQELYTAEEIKETVINLRTLDKVTLSFLSHFYQIEKSAFRCYTQSQSNQNFWD